jgi:hypothetical protein
VQSKSNHDPCIVHRASCIVHLESCILNRAIVNQAGGAALLLAPKQVRGVLGLITTMINKIIIIETVKPPI